MNEPTMESLVERVSRMEENHRRTNWMTLVLFALLTLGIVWVEGRTLKYKALYTEIAPLITFALDAEKKMGPRLYDENGKNRAGFYMWGNRPMLFFADENGQNRITLGIDEDGASLRIFDKGGKGGISLGATSLVMKDTEVKQKLPESALFLFNKDGKVIWSAP